MSKIEPQSMPNQARHFLQFEVFHSIHKLVTELDFPPQYAVEVYTHALMPGLHGEEYLQKKSALREELHAFYTYQATRIYYALRHVRCDDMNVFYRLHAGTGILRIREITEVGQPRIVEIRDKGLDQEPATPVLRIDMNPTFLKRIRHVSKTLNTLDGELVPFEKLPQQEGLPQ